MKMKRGMSLVELMVPVAIIGIGIFGILKLINYVRTAETYEAIHMAERINAALVGYIGSNPINLSKLSSINNNNILSSKLADSTLKKLIPTLNLPLSPRFIEYVVSAQAYPQTPTAGQTQELITCIKATAHTFFSSTTLDTTKVVLFSSRLSTEIGWENYINRQLYVGETTASSGGSCNADGTVKKADGTVKKPSVESSIDSWALAALKYGFIIVFTVLMVIDSSSQDSIFKQNISWRGFRLRRK